MKKRGLSSIVASVLIILLVIVAIGIVWTVIKPSIIKSAKSATLECIKVDLAIESVNCSTRTIRLTSNAGDLEKLRFSFVNATDSKVVDKTGSLKQMETKVYSFNANETVASMTQVKVTAILISETGEEKICETPATASC